VPSSSSYDDHDSRKDSSSRDGGRSSRDEDDGSNSGDGGRRRRRAFQEDARYTENADVANRNGGGGDNNEFEDDLNVHAGGLGYSSNASRSRGYNPNLNHSVSPLPPGILKKSSFRDPNLKPAWQIAQVASHLKSDFIVAKDKDNGLGYCVTGDSSDSYEKLPSRKRVKFADLDESSVGDEEVRCTEDTETHSAQRLAFCDSASVSNLAPLSSSAEDITSGSSSNFSSVDTACAPMSFKIPGMNEYGSEDSSDED